MMGQSAGRSRRPSVGNELRVLDHALEQRIEGLAGMIGVRRTESVQVGVLQPHPGSATSHRLPAGGRRPTGSSNWNQLVPLDHCDVDLGARGSPPPTTTQASAATIGAGWDRPRASRELAPAMLIDRPIEHLWSKAERSRVGESERARVRERASNAGRSPAARNPGDHLLPETARPGPCARCSRPECASRVACSEDKRGPRGHPASRESMDGCRAGRPSPALSRELRLAHPDVAHRYHPLPVGSRRTPRICALDASTLPSRNRR